jgi:hypothetical protein
VSVELSFLQAPSPEGAVEGLEPSVSPVPSRGKSAAGRKDRAIAEAGSGKVAVCWIHEVPSLAPIAVRRRVSGLVPVCLE